MRGLEGMDSKHDRISSKSADAIDSFLNAHPELALTSYMNNVQGTERKLMCIAPKGVSLPPEFAESILEYQTRVVLQNDASQTGRVDCVDVAAGANQELRKKYSSFDFSVVTSERRGAPLPFYKELGFGHHAMNVADTGEGMVIAFDLTANYNMDAERGRYDTFALVAADERELKVRLKEFFGSSWD